MKKIIAKGIENVVDALGNKIGALPSSNELYRYEKPQYTFPNEGAVFYSPDKTYSELYKSDDKNILRTTKMPENILDIREKDGVEKSYNWIKKEISNLEKSEIPNTKQDFELAKKFLEQKDAQGISSSLANLDMIYMKQSNRPLIVGMSEKKLMNELDVDAMTIKEAGRDGEDYSIAFRDNPYGALPSTNKSISDYSDIIDQSVRLDTPDAYKNIFHQDKEFAKGYGGELKSGSLKYGSEDIPPSLTDKELSDAQKEIQALTQDYLKDLPEEVTVYRYGDLDNESGVSSFTLNPNYNVDLSLPWQKRLQSPLQAFKVNKKDILASPDINTFFGDGRTFDEQEVIISNDKVKVK